MKPLVAFLISLEAFAFASLWKGARQGFACVGTTAGVIYLRPFKLFFLFFLTAKDFHDADVQSMCQSMKIIKEYYARTVSQQSRKKTLGVIATFGSFQQSS